MTHSIKQTSKFLSYILRHNPASIGLALTPQGWANLDEIIAKSDLDLTRDLIEQAVITNDKQRFSLSPDKTRIRANQGHSIEVDLGLIPIAAPDQLFHGTGEKSVSSIMATGLSRQSRQHVHLSADTDTAHKVGMRHGRPVILIIDVKTMQADGHEFYRSKNGVWLCDAVPVEYITIA